MAEALLMAPSTVVKWSLRLRILGSVPSGKVGAHPTGPIEGACAQWLLERARQDFTLRGRAAGLAERGFEVDRTTMQKFVRREGLSFKKTCCQVSRRVLTSPGVRPLKGLSRTHRSGPPGVHRRARAKTNMSPSRGWCAKK